MKRGKNFLAVFLTLALCLTILQPMPAMAAQPCFTAINERVLPLTADSMPYTASGTLYVPYSVFDSNTTGIDLGLYSDYSRVGNVISVYDSKHILVFDLDGGDCWDALTGEVYSKRAVVRGGKPYLPVDIVCTHFGLSYSYRKIEQGDLLRIRSADAVLSDSVFVDAASNILNLRLREYKQSQASTEPVVPAPQEPTPPKPVQPQPEPDEQSVNTYLAFRCEGSEFADSLLPVLNNRNVQAMFFLTPELIQTRTDLVFWMLGTGHSVGLLAQGETVEETRQILEEGSRLLEENAFLRTTVAMVPQTHQEELESEGWICWNSTLDLTPEDTSGPNYFARRVLAQLGDRKRATYLSLDVSSNTLRILPTLISQLAGEGFELHLPLETRI